MATHFSRSTSCRCQGYHAKPFSTSLEIQSMKDEVNSSSDSHAAFAPNDQKGPLLSIQASKLYSLLKMDTPKLKFSHVAELKREILIGDDGS